MTTKTLHWAKPAAEILDDSGETHARIAELDLMSVAARWSDNAPAPSLIVPCGPHYGTDPEPSADLLAQWSPDSWEPFNTQAQAVKQLAAESGTQLVILPGAGGRLSDAICTASWALAHQDFPLLLDPVGWLTPSMMTDLSDHLIRFTSLCLEISSIWGVVLRSVQENDAGNLVHAPIGEGLISNELLDKTLRTIPTPRIIECK